MSRDLHLLAVPYDAAHRDERMGRGPGALLAGGLEEHLRQQGRLHVLEWIETADPFPCEIGTTLELARRLAGAVRSAVTNDRLPLVLAGNCFTAVGTLAGLGGEDVGVVWLDCHGDFIPHCEFAQSICPSDGNGRHRGPDVRTDSVKQVSQSGVVSGGHLPSAS